MLRKFYKNFLKKVFLSIGLHTVIKKIEYHANNLPKFIKYKLSGSSYTLSISKASADFMVDFFEEFKRLHYKTDSKVELKYLLKNAQEEDIFWDIGANIGTHSLLMASVLSSGYVYSFEPHPSNYSKLQENIEKNRFENIKVMKNALGNEDKKLYLTNSNTVPGYGEHQVTSSQSDNKIPIKVRKADDISECDNPTIVKIDVEGAEMDVLRGMEKILKNNVRYIICEVHRSEGSEVTEATNLLSEYGFDINIILDNGHNVQIEGIKY